MKIDIEEARNGNLNGSFVYICHYNQPDLNKKPLRNVKPQKVLVRSDKETDKTIYYSNSFFSPLNKKDEPLKTVIQPFDNTGYKHRTGESVHVFDNMDECVDRYRKDVKKVVYRLEIKKNNVQKEIQQEIDRLEGLIL